KEIRNKGKMLLLLQGSAAKALDHPYSTKPSKTRLLYWEEPSLITFYFPVYVPSSHIEQPIRDTFLSAFHFYRHFISDDSYKLLFMLLRWLCQIGFKSQKMV